MTPGRTAKILSLLIALAPAWAGAEVQGRGSASVSTGGGYASDLFLGAGLAPTSTATLAPTGSFDLSLSPWLKLFTRSDAALEHYFETGGTAYVLDGELLVQARPWSFLYPELLLTAEGDWYQELLGPPDPALPELPGVSTSRLLQAGAAVRGFAGAFELRALLLVGQRVSTGLTRYEELPLNAQASFGLPLPGRWRLGGYYRFTANSASSEGYSFIGHELAASVAFRATGRITLRASAGARHLALDQGQTEDLPRATLSTSVLLVGPLAAELSTSGELLVGHDPDGTAHMLTLFGGLRVEGGPWLF